MTTQTQVPIRPTTLSEEAEIGEVVTTGAKRIRGRQATLSDGEASAVRANDVRNRACTAGRTGVLRVGFPLVDLHLGLTSLSTGGATTWTSRRSEERRGRKE